MIFIDSDALIGLTLPQDPHHAKASVNMAQLSLSQEELVTSWETIDEVVTKLSMFHNKQVARDFIQTILPTTKIRTVYIDQLLSIATLKIFDKQTSKNVSLTDCANIAICRSLGITHIFSFDPHYSQNGLTLLIVTPTRTGSP